MKNGVEMILLYEGKLKYLRDSLPIVQDEISEAINQLEKAREKIIQSNKQIGIE